MDTIAAPQSPESGETAKLRRRPGFGTRWGIVVQRHSSHGQHQVRGVGHITPTGPKALGPERKAPSTTSSTPSSGLEPLPAVQEVWFSGCHSDVGGGAVRDTVRYSLGDISLRWMVKQVILSHRGIRFDVAALRRADIDISTIFLAGPAQQTVDQLWRRKSEAEAVTISSALLAPSGEDGGGGGTIPRGREKDVEEQVLVQEEDVLTDTHDKLKSQPWWWFLELMPMKFVWQEADGKWKSRWGYALTNTTLWPMNSHRLVFKNPFLELTLAAAERSRAHSPISTKACGRGWLLQIQNMSPTQDGPQARNDTLNEKRLRWLFT